MAQTFTFIAVAGAAGLALWLIWRAAFRRHNLDVAVRLDRTAPGAHLIWDIANVGQSPVKLDKLIVRGRRGSGVNESVPIGLPRTLASQDRVLVPTDVDWSLLAARSIAIADTDGRVHAVPRRQLAAIQEQLRHVIDRRVYNASARDFVSGAANLAFSVLILGLGFFMLMWVIATG
jgi:hypothetical protein